MESKSSEPKSISFEFFPPNSAEALEKLVSEAHELSRFEPEFFSVTFGAGGGTRKKTLQTANSLNQKIKNSNCTAYFMHISKFRFGEKNY